MDPEEVLDRLDSEESKALWASEEAQAQRAWKVFPASKG